MSVKQHEAFCFDSFQDMLLFFDDFHGDQIQDEWDLTVTGTGAGAVVDQQTGGIYRLRCPAAADAAWIDWNDIRSLHVDQRVSMEVRFRVNDWTDHTIELSLRFDASNQIVQYLQINAQGWWFYCEDGGVLVARDSGFTIANNTWYIARIEVHTHGGNHVHFYLDGVECANSPETINIPDDATDFLQPFLYSRADVDAAVEKQLDIDYCYVRQER